MWSFCSIMVYNFAQFLRNGASQSDDPSNYWPVDLTSVIFKRSTCSLNMSNKSSLHPTCILQSVSSWRSLRLCIKFPPNRSRTLVELYIVRSFIILFYSSKCVSIFPLLCVDVIDPSAVCREINHPSTWYGHIYILPLWNLGRWSLRTYFPVHSPFKNWLIDKLNVASIFELIHWYQF